ncbi:hypothetical protein ABPG77_007300 [Micractinium sp. CCAP 211/92]
MSPLRVLILHLLALLAGGRPVLQPKGSKLDALISLQGSRPVDIDGNEVHAHGGQLLQEGGLFYWVGTSQKRLPSWTSTHINLYSSPDLTAWRFEGALFDWQQIEGFPGLLPYGHMYNPPPPFRIERPKVQRHPRSGRHILYFHLDTPDFEAPALGMAVSSNGIAGPYTWAGHIFPDNNTSYDMTVWSEPGTDSAYLVRSCPVQTLAVSKLRDDWLDTTGSLCSETHVAAEGPAVFRHRGRHLIFTSHLTGWDPNPPILFESEAGGLCASNWRLLPRPSHGPSANTTYDAQSTHIFTFTFEDGEELLLWMGDRWHARGPGSVGNASYVWLPLLPHTQGSGFELVWAEGWSLRQFKGATWDPSEQRVLFATEPSSAIS